MRRRFTISARQAHGSKTTSAGTPSRRNNAPLLCPRACSMLARMKLAAVAAILACITPLSAELKSGPPMPHKLVPGWGKLPKGWNFGECSGVAVDKDDNVWVFNRGLHPVIQFDKSGKMLQAWSEVPVTSSHGIRVDPEGNIWTVDVAAHRVLKYTPAGRLLMMIGQVGGKPGDNNDTKDGFNRPTNLVFAPNG